MTTENNKLIAEFMGMELGDDKTMYYDDAENLHPPTPINELKFHSSWDWLMPVLKKINSEISPNTRGLWRMIINPTEYDIENVYSQAVYFINEYNK